jgi:hypothetical protein
MQSEGNLSTRSGCSETWSDEEIGECLRKYKDYMEVSWYEISKETGISTQCLYNIVEGKSDYPKFYRRTKKLLEIIGVSLVALFVSISVLAQPTSHGTDTAHDSDNHLTWKRTPYAPKNWSTAKSNAEASELNGYSSWRLPSRAELQTLVDSTKVPQIYPIIKLGSNPNRWSCWSDEEVTDTDILDKYVQQDRAYFVFFGDGEAYHDPQADHHAYLIVRASNGLFDSNSAQLKDSSAVFLLGTIE